MSRSRSAVMGEESLAAIGLHSNLLNLLSQAVVYQDASGRLVSANPAADRLLGLHLAESHTQSLFSPLWKIIREDGSDFPPGDFPWMLAIRIGQTVGNVVMGACPSSNGSPVWLRVNSRPEFVNGMDKPAMVVSTFEDISETKKYKQLFRASTASFKTLVETFPDAVVTCDLEGHFLTANQPALEMLCYHNFDELKAGGLTCFDTVAEPAWMRDKTRLLKALLRESPRKRECKILRRDGSTLPAEVRLALLLDTENKPQAFLAIGRDMTHSKRGAADLRKLSQAVVQSADSIFITDTDGLIEYANPQFEQRTGYSLAEAIGQNPRLLKSGEHDRDFYNQMWNTIKSGQIWRGELHNKRKNGSLFWEEVSIAPVLNESGQLCNFVSINKEITERKQLEQALRIKDSAIESSINAILLADLEGKLTYVNPAFLRLGGFLSVDEVIGKPVMSFWQEPILIDQDLHTILEKGSWQGELSVRRNDGVLVDLAISAHLVRDDHGKPLCMMSSLVDITARKQAEAAEREEHRLAEALRKTAEALSSTLKLDDVLDLILENAGQVIATDSISIMLLEGQKLKVVRHRGYVERGMRTYIETTDFKLESFPLLCAVLESRQSIIIPDVRNSSEWKEYANSAWIHSYAAVPICRREQVIGFLNLNSSTPNFFSPNQASSLQAFASQVAVAIENARLYEQDHILSITDGLTGLHTSRYFFELAKLEFERTRRYDNDLSIVMIDVDYFKRVNDTYGHLVGDDVLREIARRVRSCLRVVDIAARFGGEEFVLLMAHTSQAEAFQVAERVRATVAGSPIDVPGGQPVLITISLGVATLSSVHQDLNMLVKSADDALYAAKFAGRNRSLVWQAGK